MKDLLKDESYLKTLGNGSLPGFAISYLMEGSGVPMIRDDNYDHQNVNVFKDYLPNFDEGIRSDLMPEFWKEIVEYADNIKDNKILEEAIANTTSLPIDVVRTAPGIVSSCTYYAHLIISNLKGAPGHLFDTFREIIISEPDLSKRTEYQLMDINILSATPLIFKDNIIERLKKIDPKGIVKETEEIFNKAKEYFST